MQSALLRRLIPFCLLACFVTSSLAVDPPGASTTNPPAKKEPPMTPGGKWRAHDKDRPRPAVIVPPTASTGSKPGKPPSDAIVLFNGQDLSHWRREAKGNAKKADLVSLEPGWKIVDGCIEAVPKGGWLYTKEKFADCQIHIEWATPFEVKGSGQGRGNSGIYIGDHPEIQVLDSWKNDTYPDGQAGALYGLYPPLVNATRAPGEWQSYDIIYVAPRLERGALVKPARYTVLLNGVLLHHSVEVPGREVECAIGLQDHNNPVQYRNIWVRKLKNYDECFFRAPHHRLNWKYSVWSMSRKPARW